MLRQINASETEAQLFSRIASSILYTNPALRAPAEVLSKNAKGQSTLWSYSISGDLPIVLLQVSDSNNLTLIRQMNAGAAYWLFKGLVIDLVIINEDHTGYRQILQEQVQSLIAAGIGMHPADKQGNVVVRLSDQISNEDRVLLQTVARVIISDKNGTLLDHVNRRQPFLPNIPFIMQSRRYEVQVDKTVSRKICSLTTALAVLMLMEPNMLLQRERRITPLPWSNVIANPNFGTIVTESGPGYTWAENAHEFRLTPWNNDAVSNNCGEAFYVRDEESGNFWSPTPTPTLANATYTTRHGFGYSVFETRVDGISTEMWVYVDREAQLKFTVVKIKNLSGRTRSLSATGYAEWVLGALSPSTAMHVVTEFDIELNALITRNSYNTEFPIE